MIKFFIITFISKKTDKIISKHFLATDTQQNALRDAKEATYTQHRRLTTFNAMLHYDFMTMLESNTVVINEVDKIEHKKQLKEYQYNKRS